MQIFAVVAALVSVVYAERFTVTVGDNGGLTYSPESVIAKVGDTVAFRFMSKNHTVTQSSFAKPCEPLTSPTAGIDSGYLPVPAGSTQFPEWSFTIDNDTTPFWFFCNQAPHCSLGMVFAVNPTAEKTFEAFKATATGAQAPGGSPSPSGTTPSNGTADPSATASSAGTSDTPSDNGAGMLSGSTTAMLAALGLVAGLVL